MYNLNKNNYNKNPKNSSVYTPEFLAQRIYEVVKQSRLEIKVVLEPALGSGNLIKPFRDVKKIGVDINDVGKRTVNQFIQQKFEDTTVQDYKWIPDLIIANPPFNACPGRKLYTEVFLRHAVELFGKIPMVMITPYGLRLNQRTTSDRWHWMRDNVEITSIISLPLDIFENVQFHSEVLFFNIPKIKPHYFLN